MAAGRLAAMLAAMTAGPAGKYMSLTSFRRDGSPVATPVWFVPDDGRLLVITDAESFKVKRIRRNPAVTVAACTMRGRERSPPRSGLAEVLPAGERERVEPMFGRRYPIETALIRPIRAIQAALHIGRRRGEMVVVAITTTDDG